MKQLTVVHINKARTGPEHPEALPPHRIVLSCEVIHGYPLCMGAAAMGPERCTCDTLTQAQHELCLADAWEAWAARGGDMCGDCAFRKGSPEQEQLEKIAASSTPFRCHQGMPVDARSGKPVQDAYVPVLVVDRETQAIEAPGFPICAGWLRARQALEKRA